MIQRTWTPVGRRSTARAATATRNHLNVDARHKLVRNDRVTPANLHESQVFDEVIDPDNEDPDVRADSAYRSEATEARLEGATYLSHIHEKGQAGQPLNDEQTQRNQERARVEHLFGFQENSLGGKRVRTLGLARAKIKIGLMNLAYNLCRYAQLCRRAVCLPPPEGAACGPNGPRNPSISGQTHSQ